MAIMSDDNVLQNDFLKGLCQEQAQVSVFLVNGIKLHGMIEQYDEHVIMLKGSVTQMIYKHAISTVVPARPIGAGDTA